MINITQTLQGLTSGYTVFEKNQVLTEGQLNDLAEYLNEQGRLTRIGLGGVGIACGLKISMQGRSRVRVTKGTGITTDGDLILSAVDQEYDRFKPYDDSAPAYAPLFVDQRMVPAFELVATGVRDDRATNLSGFEAATDRILGDMVAVLLMESFVKDDDLCRGTDCDNLGGGYLNTVRLLLVDGRSAQRLKEAFQTLDSTFERLAHLTAARAVMTSSIASPAGLARAYRTACNGMHADLVRVLPKLHNAGSWFISDLFPSDPSGAWIARLEADKKRFTDSETGLQYYYSHLKNLVETWNLIRNVLFGERAVCSPPVTAFPKHLLLGPLVNPSKNMALRTRFYPSPVVREHTDRWGHARSLIWRLHTMINTFRVPAPAADIRVTPSHFEDRPLEDRAIPYFYEMNAELPIHRAWNFELDRRGMENHNYSYNADKYNAQGPARNPLAAQIGAFPFFRIEGHLGLPVSRALALVKDQIQRNNLPFAVNTVMLGANKVKVFRPPLRYTEFHRLHHLVRQDVVQQLDDVAKFSSDFKGKVDQAVADKVLVATNDEAAAAKRIAMEKDDLVTTKSAAVRGKLSQPYSKYVADKSWTSDLNDTITAAGDFKSDLGKVIKTEFTTPFDGLIGNPHIRWIEWLDKIIKDKDDKEDEKLLFSTFAKSHSGAEHYGGAFRGGTFILVYDEAQIVIGDFTVPYQYQMEVDEEPEQPPLPAPPIKIPWLKGIKVLPPLDRFVGDKIDVFQAQIEPLKAQILTQMTYVEGMKDSIGVIAGVGTKGAITGLGGVTNPVLSQQVATIAAMTELANTIRNEIVNPALGAEAKAQLTGQLKNVERYIANQATSTADTLNTLEVGISAGGEGNRVISFLANSLSTLNDKEAVATAVEGLTRVAETTTSPDLKIALGEAGNIIVRG